MLESLGKLTLKLAVLGGVVVVYQVPGFIAYKMTAPEKYATGIIHIDTYGDTNTSKEEEFKIKNDMEYELQTSYLKEYKEEHNGLSQVNYYDVSDIAYEELIKQIDYSYNTGNDIQSLIQVEPEKTVLEPVVTDNPTYILNYYQFDNKITPKKEAVEEAISINLVAGLVGTISLAAITSFLYPAVLGLLLEGIAEDAIDLKDEVSYNFKKLVKKTRK